MEIILEKWKIPFATCFVLISISTTNARESIVPCKAETHAELNKLERKYELDGIRIFYTEQAPTTGADHRLPAVSLLDTNGNGVSDFIENIAKQADVARRAYNLLGFRDPLDSAKYRAVEKIDINILNMEYNGLAYHVPVSYPTAPNRGDDCTLRIDISSRLELTRPFTTGWNVALHEMFHIFQYGQTNFKRSWVNEPLATWAEFVFRVNDFFPLDAAYSLPTMKTTFQNDIIANPNSAMAYRFWSRLIDLIDVPANNLRLPASLPNEKYTDGQPVFKDQSSRCAALVSKLYQSFGAEDNVVSYQNGLNPYNWPAADKTSPAHDDRLLRTIQEAVRHTGISNPELNSFLQIQ
ncbi:hypothetical protein OKW45_003419 [Paraburkholderia sp. WSM4175]|uniref:hypothetical protein n=1 Tax=Paraburkholderia sp. WSM4175 TaxID=2991072 RepID=UPI003D22AA9E